MAIVHGKKVAAMIDDEDSMKSDGNPKPGDTRDAADSLASSVEGHLDRIPTEKSGILFAIGEPIEVPNAADDAETRRRKEAARDRQLRERERFLKRYQAAIMAYFGAMLRDTDAVTAVWDTFVEKWLEGKLSGYDQSRSFRKYLKTVMRHDVYAYWRAVGREADLGIGRLESNYDHPDALETTASEAFDRKLQDSILDRALQSVRDEDALYFEALKSLMNAVASETKAPSSRELAAVLSEIGGAKISEDNARQIKKRAREMFARKIIEQVGLLIGSENLAEIERVLIDLELIPYCAKALRKLRGEG